MKTKYVITILIFAGMMLCHLGCSENPGDSAPESSPPEPLKSEQPEASARESDQKSDQSDHSTPPETTTPSDSSVCTTVPSSDLTAITGVEYPIANATANFPTIRHCEYSTEDAKYSVSLLIAFNATAEQRMEQNRQFPGIVAEDDLGDDAIWEPAQGSLTVLDGTRCTEVRLSTSHGNDETRRAMARKITKLILARY